MDEPEVVAHEEPHFSDPKPAEKEELVWEDPPAINSNITRVWEPRLFEVMTQPAKWARVLECPGVRRAETHVSNLRSGKVHVPPGVWEFASRSNKQEGKSWVYARYLGPEGSVENPESFTGAEGHGAGDDRESGHPDSALREREPDQQAVG